MQISSGLELPKQMHIKIILGWVSEAMKCDQMDSSRWRRI